MQESLQKFVKVWSVSIDSFESLKQLLIIRNLCKTD